MIPRLLFSKRLALLSLAVLLLALTACQSAAVETTTVPAPTAADAYPAGAWVDSTQTPYQAYPAADDAAAAEAPATDPNTGYPAVPMGVAAIENNSKVTARLVSITPDADPAGFSRLRVVVLSTEAIPGMQSFTSELVDQEVELLVEPVNLPDLAAGDTFAAEVEYRGDESGGMYFAKNLTKINP